MDSIAALARYVRTAVKKKECSSSSCSKYCKPLAFKPHVAADCKLRLRVASYFGCPLQATLASTLSNHPCRQKRHACCLCVTYISAKLSGPMSVEIKQDIRLSFDAGKFISVPDALILEHDGEQFLKVKATSASIISVITGKVAPKNGSFATSKNLQELLRLRNEADAERDASRAAGEAEDLFKNVASEPPCKKVKVQMKKPDLNEHTVSIMVKDCNVVCLMAGIRPSKSDLTVKVNAEMLSVVFQMLREDIDVALDACRRSYTKKES